ncbi:hypothetical protein HN803_07430 [candidate division WWE3 bacterium]|jgi:hypothetical protein|nr:hypothetical protein [Candidatus Scalindua sp.]MBT7350583.1 hypothetical protein [candidate division WWE3 bacterium]
MAKCTKKCCDCQNVIGSGEFAKCCAPQNIDKEVTKALELIGIENPPNKYRCDYVKLQRKEGWIGSRILNFCGKEGRWFTPKEENNGRT